jgi:hypothetical protein
MPFQISELVIRVTGDTPDGAVGGDQPTQCLKGTTCKAPGADTHCIVKGTTCVVPPPDTSECRKGGTTCVPPTDDPTSTCRHGGTTCRPGPSKSQPPKKAELDFVLQQIRDTIASESVEDEALVTA